MTIAKEVVYALHQRIKDLSQDASPDKVAYLAKALESIAGQSTVFDIVSMTDEKLKELLDSTTDHLKSLNSSKVNAVKAISDLEKESLKKINDQELKSLSILDTRKDANIAAINTAGDLENLRSKVDVSDGSSVMKELELRATIQPGALPFLFGVLSRQNDYSWGSGHFTTELGKWYQDTSYTDNMFSLLVGSHNYDTSYVSFYRPPSINFLQGKKGTFIYRELYLRHTISSNEYTHPYAILGAIFVKNTTKGDITRTINFVGSSYWNSQYEGAGAFVGTPSKESLSWKNIYNLGSSNSGFSASGSVIVPAGQTVVILLYTSPYYYTSDYNHYTQFMQWGIYNFRSNFLTDGLEIDAEKTLKAWQCPGLANTYELWV